MHLADKYELFLGCSNPWWQLQTLQLVPNENRVRFQVEIVDGCRYYVCCWWMLL